MQVSHVEKNMVEQSRTVPNSQSKITTGQAGRHG